MLEQGTLAIGAQARVLKVSPADLFPAGPRKIHIPLYRDVQLPGTSRGRVQQVQVPALFIYDAGRAGIQAFYIELFVEGMLFLGSVRRVIRPDIGRVVPFGNIEDGPLVPNRVQVALPVLLWGALQLPAFQVYDPYGHGLATPVIPPFGVPGGDGCIGDLGAIRGEVPVGRPGYRKGLWKAVFQPDGKQAVGFGGPSLPPGTEDDFAVRGPSLDHIGPGVPGQPFGFPTRGGNHKDVRISVILACKSHPGTVG